jgi:benzylsuccinate CoA-transferase BbsF subunit
MSMMQEAGVPAGIVATGEDLIEHDLQLKHRHVYHKLEHPEIGTYHGVAPAYEFSKCPAEIERSPLMGEHNESALSEILGMSDEEIKTLIREQVIE